MAEYEASQDEVIRVATELFAEVLPMDRYIPIFDNAAIRTRRFVVPLSWFSKPHDLAEKNRTYVTAALKLAEEAITNCLTGAGRNPEDVDHLFLVSSTGLATPTIDAHLMNRLGFRTDMKRSPLWGLGCAGGATGLSRAWEWAASSPGRCALLVAVECCSLTFQYNDRSKRNLVAAALFADGAAAVLIDSERLPNRDTQPDRPRSHPLLQSQAISDRPCEHGRVAKLSLIGTFSHTWPQTLDMMGWDVVADGLQVVFSQGIPLMVETQLRRYVCSFLEQHDLTLEDIHHWIVHPGGTRVLTAYQKALDLSRDRLQHAYDVLFEHGNMSSPTVLHVLERVHAEACPGERGIIIALGPGFSLEMILVQWE